MSAVERIINQLDQFEAEYLPEGFIAPYKKGEGMVFIGKFEMCKDALTMACLERGIWIWCVDNKDDLFHV